MDITKAEYLPNELWIEVFSYLENADLLYAFNILNKHFQKRITPYFNDIDLSEVSLSLKPNRSHLWYFITELRSYFITSHKTLYVNQSKTDRG
jgi:hypothetical protein